jgi:hypothetical protein
MLTDEQIHLKYPIGKFYDPGTLSYEEIRNFFTEIEGLPEMVEKEFAMIKKSNLLERAYRPNGWTARQVIHHLADSHMNALIRFKLTLTEEHPTIKPYLEARWAELPDVKLDPQISIDLLKGVHVKLISLMKKMTEQDFEKVYFHPESQKEFRLSTATALYAWHGKHHLAHLRIINGQL